MTNTNLIDISKEFLNDNVIGKLSTFLGEERRKVRRGFLFSIASLLNLFIANTEDKTKVQLILDFLKDPRFDGTMINELDQVIGGGPATSGIMDSGGAVIRSQIGDGFKSLVDNVVSDSAISSVSAQKLLPLVASFLLNLIKKHRAEESPDATGLIELLNGQKEGIASFLTKGVAEELIEPKADTGENKVVEMQSPGTTPPTTVSKSSSEKATTSVVKAKSSATPSFLKWLIPVILILGLAWVGYRYLVHDDNVDREATIQPDEEDIIGVESETESAPELVGDRIDEMINSGSDLKGQAFKLKNLKFEEGKVIILESSIEELENLANILNIHDDLKVELVNFTTNSGDTNTDQILSEGRAYAIQQKLIELGAEPIKISAIGLGSSEISEEGTEIRIITY